MLSLNVVTVTEGDLSELLYAGDLDLISETIEGLRDKFLKWKKAFESNGLKVNLGKTKVIFSSGITQDSLSKSKVEPCGICSFRLKANSELCVQCGRMTHGRCARVKRATQRFSRNIKCRKCERNIGEAVEQEGKSCD